MEYTIGDTKVSPFFVIHDDTSGCLSLYEGRHLTRDCIR